MLTISIASFRIVGSVCGLLYVFFPSFVCSFFPRKKTARRIDVSVQVSCTGVCENFLMYDLIDGAIGQPVTNDCNAFIL